MKRILLLAVLFLSILTASLNAREVSLESKITGLYVAFFNRAGDQEGLTYWTQRGSSGGNVSDVLKELSAGFATHPSFARAYGELDNRAFVEAIYRNALGRDGDEEGILFWTNMLNNNTSRSDMVSIFVEASLVGDLTQENYPNLTTEELAAAQLRQDLITNKVTVALAFTHQLEDLSNVTDNQNPESDPAYLASIKIISKVTEDPATVQEALDFLESISGSGDPIGDILATAMSKLKKTGQTIVYTPYDDGFYQKGVTPDYTRDDAKEIVKDNITGLMWEDDAAAASTTATWQEANNTCEALTLGDYDYWRLPTAMELLAIVDNGRVDPAIDTSKFVNTASNDYWSATTNATITSNARLVHFHTGYTGNYGKDSSHYVRCVRGAPLTPPSLSRDATTEIVTDATTHLQWQDDAAAASTTATWQGAIDTCEALELGGYTDWRLPNKNELLSIVDLSRYSPAIYGAFQNTSTSNYYWSATNCAACIPLAWTVYFNYGNTSTYHKNSSSYVRCVRAEQ